MPHDIIDSRESYLEDAVRPLLKQSVRAHCAVGFFFLSGLKAIAADLGQVKEVFAMAGKASAERQDNIELNSVAHGIGILSLFHAH